MTTIYGLHSPFDSDSCLEWGIFCQTKKHDPNMPIEFNEVNKGSIFLQTTPYILYEKSKPNSNPEEGD